MVFFWFDWFVFLFFFLGFSYLVLLLGLGSVCWFVVVFRVWLAGFLFLGVVVFGDGVVGLWFWVWLFVCLFVVWGRVLIDIGSAVRRDK